MIRINGFDNYFLCLKTAEVFSKRGKNTFQALKRHSESGGAYYFLSLNGNKERVPLSRILRENLKEIEEYFSKNSSLSRVSVTRSASLCN